MKPKDNQTKNDDAYLLPTSKVKAVLQPLSGQADDASAPAANATGTTSAANPATASGTAVDTSNTGADLAADVIRSKIQSLYSDEPDAQEELVEAEQAGTHRSKHQQYMWELSNSGKPQEQIQTLWHEYYQKLPDHEKHEVWQEFYAHHAAARSQAAPTPQPEHDRPTANHRAHTAPKKLEPSSRNDDRRSIADIKNQLTGKIRARGQLKAKHHLQSLLFGLAMGSTVLLIMLFGFFNERIIAPFITPSRNVSATPIIIDPDSPVSTKESKIIIPKINVEIPVVYDEPSIEESAIQKALERGVVHYATTPKPGEAGNGAIVGHSSNNILNKGQYKFAFVLLSRLEPGDTFYLTKDGKRYAYRIFDKKVVKPTDLSVLDNRKNKPATMTLITCDPPGTSINRLVVVGEQITPDPAANVASSAKKVADEKPAVVPGNAPSLWQRIVGIFSS
jgi:sortase A